MHNRAKLLMTALAMANLVLLYRIDQQGNRLDETQSQNNARREKISYPATERSLLLSHLRDVLRSSDQSSFVLEGQDAARDKAVRYRAEDLDMVYVLSTQCAGCAVNLPLLIRMYSGGTRMVGISSQDSPGSLRAYVEQHKIPFPIVSRASGLVFRTLSKGTTPATVIFKNGEVNDLRVGDLTRAFPEAAQVTTRWTGDILSLLLANTSLIAPTSTEIPMAGNNRISKWTQVATSVAVMLARFWSASLRRHTPVQAVPEAALKAKKTVDRGNAVRALLSTGRTGTTSFQTVSSVLKTLLLPVRIGQTQSVPVVEPAKPVPVDTFGELKI